MILNDRLCGLFVLLLAGGVLTASGVRWATNGPTRYARVEADGGSVLLGQNLMNMVYWALQPVADLCISLGITANAITGGSLVLGACSGVAMYCGAFGLGAVFVMLSSVGDALDGLVARKTGLASDAGEVFDAAVDRYVEFFFIGGILLHYTQQPWVQALALASLAGSFMISYSSAKAEALRVVAPRGSMRRAERAVYLTMAAALTPLVGAIRGVTPLMLALALVALVANASAIGRLRSIARSRKNARGDQKENGVEKGVASRALPLREGRP